MSRDGNGNDNGMKKIQLIHDASSIYYLHPSESPSNSLSKYLLTGDKNYYTWVKAITNALEGRNKLGFITGEFAPPEDATTPEFSSWKSNNSIICSWLFNSVDASIQPSIASHKIAKTLWEDLAERYSITDGQRIHQLKSEYTLLRQKGLSVDAYYNKFKSVWYELRGLEDVTCACTCSAAPKIRAQAEQDKTYGFLMGLDDNQFGEIRTQILGMDPLPTLNRAFYIVMSKAMNLEDDNTESVDQENIPIEEVFEQLKCTREGLTSEEAAYRLELFGPNKLEEKKENKILKFLGFIKRNNRVNLDPKCKVLRDKQWKVSEAAILVPGDIISITLGDIVPADARLLEGDSILVDQSALTGESLPVTRVPGEEVFSGSICTQGETEAIVIATGVHTFFGNAAAHLVDTTNNVGHSKKE